MKLSISIVIAIHLVALTFAFDVETERLIDDFVENFMRNHQIPGLGLSVVRNGTVLMSKGYGMRNISAGLASDENTLFPIGSITKTFVAVLVVKTLNELYPQRGVAVLDIPIAQLIPPTVNFTLSDRYRAEQTTFRDILAHRHCLHTGEVDAMFGSVPSAAEYAFRARYLPEICEFRNGFSYNNNMMSLAGEYIAAIAGTTLQNMVLSFARDIGMSNTTYIDFNGTYESLPDMSQPYLLRNGTIVQFDIFQIRKLHIALGAGGILSTANDMTKYMDFHLNRGRVGNRQIVPANVMGWLYTTSFAFDFQGGRRDEADSIVNGDLGRAQGFSTAIYDGWSVIRHGGYLPPYQSDMRLFPAARIGIYICSNGPGTLRNYPTLADTSSIIFDLVRGANRSFDEIVSRNANIGTPFDDHQIFERRNTNRASTVLHYNQMRQHIDLTDVVGVYGHPYDGDVSIRYAPGTDNSTLQLYFSEWAHGRLQPIPESNTTFSIMWDTSIMDHFYSYSTEPNFWIDFGIVDTVLFRVGDVDIYAEFVKNATLDTFPAIPWTPTSCGPE